MRRTLFLLVSAFLVTLLASQAAVAEPSVGDTVSSQGAGTEATGDLVLFKNNKRGAFVAMRADAGDFEVQTLRKSLKRGSKKVYNVAVGVKVNAQDDRVIYKAKTDTLTLNGEPLALVDGEPPTGIDGGGTVEKDGSLYTVTSEAGDQVVLLDVRRRVDITIQAGPNRQGDELKGSLGQLNSDADPSNDLVFPEDQAQATSAQFIARFLIAWAPSLIDSMFS